jgi:GGDEF domain-containing protein
LLAGGIGLLASPSLNATSINTALQFTLSNIAYLALLYMFACHYAQMHQMAHTDALTNLINRRGMQQKLEGELERARRYNRPFALVLADIDHFKKLKLRSFEKSL